MKYLQGEHYNSLSGSTLRLTPHHVMIMLAGLGSEIPGDRLVMSHPANAMGNSLHHVRSSYDKVQCFLPRCNAWPM